MVHSQPNVETHYAVEILPELKAYFEGKIRPEITSVKLVYVGFDVFLDIYTSTEGELDINIERSNLRFISDLESGPIYQTHKPIYISAMEFAQSDGYSLCNMANLFTIEAGNEIYDEYHRNHGQDNDLNCEF